MVGEIINNFLSKFDYLKREDDLNRKLFRRLNKERVKKLKILVYSSLAVFMVVSGAVYYALQSFQERALETGFFEYTRLLFTDKEIFVGFWKEISFSILNSLPIFEIFILALSFFTLLIFIIWGVNKYRAPLSLKQ
jgi:hypothetical protein